MFLSLKDQGQGRRRRSYSHSSVYSGHRAARSSRISLLSAFTVQSSGSNGSNSTVTQESYNKASKKKKPSRRKRESIVRHHHTAMDPVEENSLELEVDDRLESKPEVFKYLVGENNAVEDEEETPLEASHIPEEDNDSDSLHEGPETEPEDGPEDELDDGPEPEPIPYPEDASQNADFSARSFYSDSGISMDDRGSLPVNEAKPDDPLYTGPMLDEVPALIEPTRLQSTRWRYPQVPKPRHQAFAPEEDSPNDCNDAEMHDVRHGSPSPPSVVTEDEPIFPLSTDHLATRLADTMTPVLFKSFRKANYRILLQLQDEIIELQAELAYLDTIDGSRRASDAGQSADRSTSQRWQWQQRPFDLYRAKAEVMGRLQVRMDQYCKARLTSMWRAEVC
jgi:hypothetical protein